MGVVTPTKPPHGAVSWIILFDSDDCYVMGYGSVGVDTTPEKLLARRFDTRAAAIDFADDTLYEPYTLVSVPGV